MLPADDPDSTVHTVDDVLTTDELRKRSTRPPDYEGESRALAELAQEMAANPANVLQNVVELVPPLCRADSAGVGILEAGGENGTFRWHAVAGAFAANVNGTMPRDASPCGMVMSRNEPLLFRGADRFFPALRDIEPAIHENLLVPWAVNGEVIGVLWAVLHDPAGRFDAEDARLLESLSRFAAATWQTVSALEAARASRDELGRHIAERTEALADSDARIRESEEHYRTLFESIDEGFGIIERMAGEPINFRCIAANPVFSRQSGFPDVTGMTMRDVLPGESEAWFEIYDRVVRTGEPIRFEHDLETIGQTLEVYAFPVDGAESGRVGTIFQNVTARKRGERAMRESEERQSFLLDLSDALRPLADPDEIQVTASQMLGEHLGVDRVFYAEVVDDDSIPSYRVGRHYCTPGTLSVTGLHPVAAFGQAIGAAYRAGHRLAMSDVATDERLTPEDRAAFAAVDVRAFVGVPLIKDGRFVAAFGVNQRTARTWLPADVSLVDEVADRTWAAVERSLAETALRTSQERFHALITATSYAIYRMNPDWTAMRQLDGSGFLADTVEPTTAWLETYIDPADQDLVGAAIARAIESKGLFELEHRVRRVDGTIGWTLSRAVPLLDEHGDIVEWFGAASDITERKRAEAALRESEMRYRTLFESIDQGFCTIEVIFDESGESVDYRFLEINPAFARHTGLTDAIGQRMRHLRPGHEQFWFDTYGRVALTGAAERFEHEARELDRWYSIYAYRVGEPHQRRVAVLFEDITARRRAEDAIRESRAELERQAQFLDATLSNVGDYISIWDRQARFVYANRALERLWGRKRAAYAGRTTAELGYTPDQVAFFEKAIERVFRMKRVVTGELPYTDLRGASGYYEIVFSPVTGLGPRTEFVVGVARDVTSRKHREAQAAFLADVGNDFARLTAPDDIMRVVGDKMYRHFDLTRLTLSYVDEAAGTITTIHDRHGAGMSSALGASPIADFVSDAYRRRLKTGVVHAVHDIATDSFTAHQAETFRAFGVGAQLVAPFVSEGTWRFVITLQKATPYRWQQAEVDLLRELSPRLYLALERARAGTMIRESEDRFRALANLVPDLLWSTDPHGRVTWHSQRLLDYTGLAQDAMLASGWLPVIHPDNRETASRAFREAHAAGCGYQRELRLRRHDGEYRWFLMRAEPIHDEAGRIAQWFGAATDIHQARLVRDELADQVALATTELRSLSRQLLTVQEEERRHLARELHDEIGQSLTALQLQLAAAQRSRPASLADAEAIVHELTGRVSELSMDLRPAALDTLGLASALLWHSQRYEARTGIHVDLRHHGLDRRLPPEIEIGAYRIVQEALTNVARHAGVDSVSVQLLADDRLTVVIRDRGHGFDAAAMSAAGGLGGMRERVELLGGSLVIEAAVGAGTVVTAEIPLDGTDGPAMDIAS